MLNHLLSRLHLYLFSAAAILALWDYQRQGTLAVVAAVALLLIATGAVSHFVTDFLWERVLVTPASVRWEAIMLPVAFLAAMRYSVALDTASPESIARLLRFLLLLSGLTLAGYGCLMVG